MAHGRQCGARQQSHVMRPDPDARSCGSAEMAISGVAHPPSPHCLCLDSPTKTFNLRSTIKGRQTHGLSRHKGWSACSIATKILPTLNRRFISNISSPIFLQYVFDLLWSLSFKCFALPIESWIDVSYSDEQDLSMSCIRVLHIQGSTWKGPIDQCFTTRSQPSQPACPARDTGVPRRPFQSPMLNP